MANSDCKEWIGILIFCVLICFGSFIYGVVLGSCAMAELDGYNDYMDYNNFSPDISDSDHNYIVNSYTIGWNDARNELEGEEKRTMEK